MMIHQVEDFPRLALIGCVYTTYEVDKPVGNSVEIDGINVERNKITRIFPSVFRSQEESAKY